MPRQHGENCDPERINVRPNIHLLAVDLFRAGIVGSPMEACGGSLRKGRTGKVPR